MIESRFAPAALLVSIVLFSSARADAQRPVPPCCSIVSIDAKAGIVTAKVNATGNVFQFKPNSYSPVDRLRTNPVTLASLRPGQAVYANFTNHQVSLDGRTVCCTMTSGRQAAQNAFNVLPNQPGSWTTKPPMHDGRQDAAAGVVNGILYVAGGGGPNGLAATVEAYDLATNMGTTRATRWNRGDAQEASTHKERERPKAPMPTAREYPVAGVVNGILYVAGGIGPNGFVATVEAYDPATNMWTTKAPMPWAHAGAVAGVVNGILYVAIGAVEAYDPATNMWTTKAQMPTGRTHAAAGVVNGILYVAGGSARANNIGAEGNVATVEAYDPATNTWATKAPMPTARAYATGGVVNGILYVVGGLSSNMVPLHTVEAYDPATNTWTTKAPMLTALHASVAGVVNGILYVAGGILSDGDLSATVEAYQPCDRDTLC